TRDLHSFPTRRSSDLKRPEKSRSLSPYAPKMISIAPSSLTRGVSFSPATRASSVTMGNARCSSEAVGDGAGEGGGAGGGGFLRKVGRAHRCTPLTGQS